MSRMVKYAQCVTIRDKQLEEKKNRFNEHHEFNLKKDLEMELIRLEQLKYYKQKDIDHY